MGQEPTIRALAGLGLFLAAGCGSDTLRALRQVTDEFVQNSAAMVDIIWVVDNSESMNEEQQGLGASFNAFISNLVTSGVDYHVGVIETDTTDGLLHVATGMPAFVDRNTGKCESNGFCHGTLNTTCTADPQCADSVQAFSANVRVGINGSAMERGFEAAAYVLGKGPSWDPSMPEPVPVPNTGFLRRGFCDGPTCEGTNMACTTNADCDKAALLVVFVSDEDDSSFGPVRYYWRLFESYLGAGNEALVKVGAIVGPADDPVTQTGGGCYDPTRGQAAPGDRYTELVVLSASSNDAEIQSIVASICEDFNESLTSLSITAAGLKSEFHLSATASTSASIPCQPLASEAFCVKVNGTPLARDLSLSGNGWLFDSAKNSIIFGTRALPPPQSAITVRYQEQP